MKTEIKKKPIIIGALIILGTERLVHLNATVPPKFLMKKSAVIWHIRAIMLPFYTTRYSRSQHKSQDYRDNVCRKNQLTLFALIQL